MELKNCPKCNSATIVIARPKCYSFANGFTALYKPTCRECGFEKSACLDLKTAINEWNEEAEK